MKDQENEKYEKLFITIGSNINPQNNIKSALNQLKEFFGKIYKSRLYKSQAVFGPHTSEPQNDYINGAILTTSNLSSDFIKFNILRKIETSLGRVRTLDKYASRTIDLDIAFYGSTVINKHDIRIPDPDILHQSYLISPLFDLDPDYIHPEENVSLKKIIAGMDVSNLEVVEFS